MLEPIRTNHVARIDAGIAAASVPAWRRRLSSFGRAVVSAVRAIEPQHIRGKVFIERCDGRGKGFARFVDIDFLGLHLSLTYGRTPAPREG